MDKFAGYNDVCQVMGRAMLNLVEQEQGITIDNIVLMLESYIQVDPDRINQEASVLAIDALKGKL